MLLFREATRLRRLGRETFHGAVCVPPFFERYDVPGLVLFSHVAHVENMPVPSFVPASSPPKYHHDHQMNINFFETPTGWKFFGNLMDSKELGGEVSHTLHALITLAGRLPGGYARTAPHPSVRSASYPQTLLFLTNISSAKGGSPLLPYAPSYPVYIPNEPVLTQPSTSWSFGIFTTIRRFPHCAHRTFPRSSAEKRASGPGPTTSGRRTACGQCSRG